MSSLATTDIYQYTPDGRELRCHTAEPPRRFDNILYNQVYFAQLDQTMHGVPELSGRHMTDQGWVSNVVSRERIVYVRDDESGVVFSAGFAPVCRQYEQYCCTSGLNYQIIENVTDGLKVTWRLYIPAGDDPLEIWDVRVENLTDRPRRLSLVTELAMECDGVDLFGGFLYRRTAFVPEANALFVQQDGERHLTIDFPFHNAFVTADRPVASWCGNQAAFCGPRGNLANPDALRVALIPPVPASRYTPTGTLQVQVSVAPGTHADTRFLIGACDRPPMIERLRARYLGGNLETDADFTAMCAERQAMMANIQVQVPDAAMPPKFNIWLKQQIHHGAVHCRWGIKGYRDIVQQAQGVLTQAPELAHLILRKACAHQYSDGFALRGWHPIDPMRYADSAQWMVSAITEYLKETGNFEFLAEDVPFFDYGTATVYEHLRRAMLRLHTDRGAHGLCKIFFGDWNDSLTGVGRQGRGESVWLSMAFCRDALLMAELASEVSNPRDALQFQRWHEEMVKALNAHAWDGAWYLCALDDDGLPIGSQANEAGKIFLNMQSWAQLGRVCDEKHWQAAWSSVQSHLDTGWGFKLNWPTYMEPVANVGRMSYMRPGICENGSVYTHGNVFMLVALLERGMADEALALLQAIDPVNARRPVVNQPNSYFNGCLGPDAVEGPGMAEHVWATGSAAWLFFALTEYLLGLRRTYRGIVLQPCFPSAWDTASITRTYRGTTYHVTINNSRRRANPPVSHVTIDGASHPARMPLPIDGEEHQVVVDLG